ncbi:MAG: hypothetical protein ACTSYO_08710, partial [Candidatus Ranarchaeia archaeon]
MPENFEPSTPPLPIRGSSYRLQLGTINERWHVKIFRGPTEISSFPIDAYDVDSITKLVEIKITFPGMNPITIRKTVAKLMQAVESGVESILTPPPQTSEPKKQTYRRTILSQVLQNEESQSPPPSRNVPSFLQSTPPPEESAPAGTYVPPAPDTQSTESQSSQGTPVASLPKAPEPSAVSIRD